MSYLLVVSTEAPLCDKSDNQFANLSTKALDLISQSFCYHNVYHILGLERKLEESSVIKDSKGKLTLQNWRIC